MDIVSFIHDPFNQFVIGIAISLASLIISLIQLRGGSTKSLTRATQAYPNAITSPRQNSIAKNRVNNRPLFYRKMPRYYYRGGRVGFYALMLSFSYFSYKGFTILLSIIYHISFSNIIIDLILTFILFLIIASSLDFISRNIIINAILGFIKIALMLCCLIGTLFIALAWGGKPLFTSSIGTLIGIVIACINFPGGLIFAITSLVIPYE